MRLFAAVAAGAAVAAVLSAAAVGAEEKPPEGTPPRPVPTARRARVVGVETVDFSGATRVSLRAEDVGEDQAQPKDSPGTWSGRRNVDIYVGPAEGAAIRRALAGRRAKRPMTHDLLATVVSKLGAKITRLTVTTLRDGIFIGEIIVSRDGTEYAIDVRPSDGMALALVAGAPIYIAEEVLEKAGRPDEDAGEKEGEEKEEEPPAGPRPFGPPRGLI